MKYQEVIIGLVGLPGAGKTTAAKYLEQKGYQRVTLSDFIKAEARKEGILDSSREILQEYGNRMRKHYGPQALAQLALKKIRQDGVTYVVIDGIRNVYEAAYLKVENNFLLVGIKASPRVRYQRILKKRGRKWAGSYKEFLKSEVRENHLGSREIGLRVKECFKRAAYTVKNEKTLDEFYTNLENILKKLQINQTG